ncbi:MAG: zf-HC2 domain-containing protein, partial [Actinomycetota bacterium]|nr:zf-HC2 domain-containing protein [Actinomycetota bacterium]
MSVRDGHLGDFAAALVDGALNGSVRDQALAHVAGCPRCRADLDDQRRIKDQLQQFGKPVLPPGLEQRLLDIGSTNAGLPGPRVVAPAGRSGGAASPGISAAGPRRADRTSRPAGQAAP